MHRRKWHFWPFKGRNGRSLLSDRSGVTAVEFAMIALPFFILSIGIMEVGLVVVVNRMLDNAVVSAARMIRTGQAKQGTITADQFKQQVCDFMPSFMCNTDRISVEVTSVGSFAAADAVDSLYDEDGEIREDLNFATGGAGDIVVVNVIYKWPMIMSNMRLDVADRGGVRDLTSTMVFRNEPWD